MAEIKMIFEHKGHELGLNDKTGELYWDEKKIITEQKLALNWWVNIAIVLGAVSTAVMAVMAVIEFLKY